MTFKLQKKEDPTPIKESKALATKVLKNLTKLAGDKETDFFDTQVVTIIEKEFSELIELYEVQLSEEKNRPAEKEVEINAEKPKKFNLDKKDKDDKHEDFPECIITEDGQPIESHDPSKPITDAKIGDKLPEKSGPNMQDLFEKHIDQTRLEYIDSNPDLTPKEKEEARKAVA